MPRMKRHARNAPHVSPTQYTNASGHVTADASR